MAWPGAASASSWPSAGGGPARAGFSLGEPGVLPATVAWSYAGAQIVTAPVVTGGDGPLEQRVAYGTADGVVHLRELATGAEVGSVPVADAPVTDAGAALSSAFASSSSETALGQLYVVHDDGGGVEVARIDERTGARVEGDVSVPGSLGCTEIGAPLLTPAATDGTRLLLFTIDGSCPAGPGLVRFGVGETGALATPSVAAITAPTAADPALVVLGGQLDVVVGRRGGLDFRRAGAAASAEPDATLAVGPADEPRALAWPGAFLYVLAAQGSDSRVFRVSVSGARPALTDSAPVAGAPRGLAIGAGRLAVSTSSGLTVLDADLGLVGVSPGAATAPAVAGAYAYVAGRAVRLSDATTTALPVGPLVAPALARGLVVFGTGALLTTDETEPTVELARDGATAVVADDRGVAQVRFEASGRRADGVRAGSPWSPATYGSPLVLAPGLETVKVTARDFTGNVARARVQVRVPCGRSVHGGGRDDVLRGRAGRDCLYGAAGADRLLVAGGGADRVICGTGRDVVRADASDRVADDCERVRRLRP